MHDIQRSTNLAYTVVVKGGVPSHYYFGSRIWVIYVALKPSKRPLFCRWNEVANTIRTQVMGPRSGAGPTPQNVKMVPP